MLGDVRSDNVEEHREVLVKEGPYLVTHALGTGGRSSVWKGKFDKRDVVFKVSFEDLDESRIPFLNEVVTLSDLGGCSQIVEVIDYTNFETFPGSFLAVGVFEYIPGNSLRTISKNENLNITPSDILEYFVDAAKGLDYVHKMGYVHRDIKPSNMLHTGEGKHTKLCDFATAIKISGESYMTEREREVIENEDGIVGTFGYISPQYLKTGKFNKSDDYWSFASSIFSMFTNGEPPIIGDSVFDYCCKCSQTPMEIKKLSEHRGYLKKWGEPFCKKFDDFFSELLNSDMSRFESCDQVLEYIRTGLLN